MKKIGQVFFVIGCIIFTISVCMLDSTSHYIAIIATTILSLIVIFAGGIIAEIIIKK